MMSSIDTRDGADTEAPRMISVLATQVRALEKALLSSDAALRKEVENRGKAPAVQAPLPVDIPDVPQDAFWARMEVLCHVSRALIEPNSNHADPQALAKCVETLPADDRVMKLYADVVNAHFVV